MVPAADLDRAPGRLRYRKEEEADIHWQLLAGFMIRYGITGGSVKGRGKGVAGSRNKSG